MNKIRTGATWTRNSRKICLDKKWNHWSLLGRGSSEEGNNAQIFSLALRSLLLSNFVHDCLLLPTSIVVIRNGFDIKLKIKSLSWEVHYVRLVEHWSIFTFLTINSGETVLFLVSQIIPNDPFFGDILDTTTEGNNFFT